MSKLTRRELIAKISQHTNIRKDAVEQVVDGLIDVAVEEIVNDGEFNIIELFSITSKDWNKSYSINNSKEVPSRPRLIIKLSRRVRDLWKMRIDMFKGEKGVITKDNWRDANKHVIESKKAARKPLSDSTKNDKSIEKSQDEQEDYNPFLDNED